MINLNSIIHLLKILGINPFAAGAFGVLYIVTLYLKQDNDLEKLERKARITRAQQTLDDAEEIKNISNADKLFE